MPSGPCFLLSHAHPPISQLKLSDNFNLVSSNNARTLGPLIGRLVYHRGRETLQQVRFADHGSESSRFPNECFKSRGGKSSGVVRPLRGPGLNNVQQSG